MPTSIHCMFYVSLFYIFSSRKIYQKLVNFSVYVVFLNGTLKQGRAINLLQISLWIKRISGCRFLDPDLIDVTAEHELKCEGDGIVRDVFRYIGTWKNGTAKEVNKHLYEFWTNRKVCFRVC